MTKIDSESPVVKRISHTLTHPDSKNFVHFTLWLESRVIAIVWPWCSLSTEPTSWRGRPSYLACHFETSAPSDPNDLQHWKVKGTSDNTIATPESHISIRFALWLTPFEIRAILRQVNSIYILQLPSNPKFHSFLLYGQPFMSYMPFWDKCTEWPQKNELEHWKIKGTPIVSCNNLRLINRQSISLYSQRKVFNNLR